MAHKVLQWGWKANSVEVVDQITEAVRELTNGRIQMHFAEPDDDSDQFVLVIADEPLDDSSADALAAAELTDD